MSSGKNQEKNADHEDDHNLRQHHEIVDQTRKFHAHVVDEGDGQQDCRCGHHDVSIAGGDAKRWQRVARQRVTDGGQTGEHLDNHQPACPPRQRISAEFAGPLVGHPSEGNAPRQFGKDQRQQKLPHANDWPSPNKRRSGSLQSRAVGGKKSGRNRDDGKTHGEAGKPANLAFQFLFVAVAG